MKQNLVLVAALLLALPGVAYSSGSNNNMVRTSDTNTREKSEEIRNYPKTNTDSGGAGGSTDAILDRSDRNNHGSDMNNSNEINRYDKPEYPESSPGGIMGTYSSPTKKPIKNPDMGYER
ncbi:MAG TPA: hypothetical protein VGJ93_00110 [Desulfuromonadaceae bacterium]